MKLLRLGMLWAALLASTVMAQPRPMQLADLHQLQEVSEPRLSADGEWLAFVVASHNLQLDITQSRVWVMRYDGSGKRPLNEPATDRESQMAVQWAGSHELFYLSDRSGEGKQVWRQRFGEAAPQQVTHMVQGVGDYVVSPDGRRLALIAQDLAPSRTKGATEPPLVTERFQFVDGDSGVFLDARRQHLYVVDVAGGEPVLLTPGAHDESLPAWAPDGRSLAYVSKRGEDPDRHIDFNIFVVAAQAGATERQITTFAGGDLNPYWGSRPAWSPDGRRLAYLRGGDPQWLDYAPAQLAIVDLETLSVSEPARIDRYFYQPHWSADGKALLALREAAEVTHLVRIELATDALRELTSGQRFDKGFDISRDGRMVVLGNTATAPAEVFALEKELRPLSQVNDAWLADIKRPPLEEFVSAGVDGPEIHALLLKPPGYQAGQRVPLVVRLHGGPVDQFSHEFLFEWQWLAAQGFAVLGINPRGSSGRGLDFAKAIYADWGAKDVADVLAAVEHMVKLGIADPQRLLIGGHSYGSILTNYVIASDTRFKAATSSSGGSNSLALYGLDMYAREYEIELGTPWWNPEAYLRVSYPFLHADRITTPTLFLCGGDDFNVPCAGAQQMYQALRSLKVPTRFVRFPRQGHTLDVPSYLEFRLKSYLEWYQRFLPAPNVGGPKEIPVATGGTAQTAQ